MCMTYPLPMGKFGRNMTWRVKVPVVPEHVQISNLPLKVFSRVFFKKKFSKELSLQTNAQVVYFEAGKDMKVSYNRRLVGLHTEVRILGGQGYNIPQKIMATSEQARKFAKLAR